MSWELQERLAQSDWHTFQVLQGVSARRCCVVGVSKTREAHHKHRPSNWWCGACGMPYNWTEPSGRLVMKRGPNIEDQKVWPTYAALRGLCEHTMCALKLLTPPDGRTYGWRVSGWYCSNEDADHRGHEGVHQCGQ